MDITVIDVVIECWKSGEAKHGKPRFLAANTDELYKLRQTARDYLSVIPKSEWPTCKTSDEIVDEIVCKTLEMVADKTTDVSDVTWSHNKKVIHTIRLRTARAAALGVNESTKL